MRIDREGDGVAVKSGNVEAELVEEVNAKLLITDDEVKIPVNEAVYGKIKDKKISIMPETS